MSSDDSGFNDRICAADDCRVRIPPDRPARVKYHSPRCAKRQGNRNYSLRQKALKSSSGRVPLKTVTRDDFDQAKRRRGDLYQQLKARPDLVELYRSGGLTDQQLAIVMNAERSAIQRTVAALEVDEQLEEMAEEFEIDPEAQEALADFATFRERYFVTAKGEPYVTEPYHQRWIDALLETMEAGGRLMILSPPRHGKTQLLLHFCVWQIVRNPHINIVWIAGNKELAQDWIASVEEELEFNERIIEDFLPPGGTFRPRSRSRQSWSRTQFTVATRTYVVKSPTMVAVSRGAKILSRDVDLVIADDIEDHGSTIQPQNRQNTRNWWTTDVGSRIETHTAQLVIGSRQHPDDLYGHLLDNKAWESIVETAHDPGCTEDPDIFELHTDCMLWPDRHGYPWLMDMLHAAETTGGRGLWEMVYLNRPSAEGLMVFEREPILASRNKDRDLYEYPEGSVLVAGMDPSATGYQATFLWGYEPHEHKLYMVDLENHEGGGIRQARAQVEHWFDGMPMARLYCREWYIEDNLYRGAIYQDEVLQSYARSNLINLHPHHTDRTNKWDRHMGVTSMASWFESGRIDLPYGSPQAKAKTDLFIRQLLNFQNQVAQGGRTRNAHSDLVMAAWFPFPHFAKLQKQRGGRIKMRYSPSYLGYTSKPMFTYKRKAAS